jgi:plastocyanin
MDQQGQMFMPDTLLARTGQPVHFRSSEDVLHNVRVIRRDKKPIFNVATRHSAATPTPSTSPASTTSRVTFTQRCATPIEKTVEIAGPRLDVSLR